MGAEEVLKMNHVEVFGQFLNDRQEKKTYSLGNILKEVLNDIELYVSSTIGVERLPTFYLSIIQISLWDNLPLELQEYIVSLATWQHIRDRRRNRLLCQLLEKINDYGLLKQRWTIGPIKILRKRCSDPNCTEMCHYHSQVLGRRLKTPVQGGEYEYLGYSVRFATYNAPGLQTRHLH